MKDRVEITKHHKDDTVLLIDERVDQFGSGNIAAVSLTRRERLRVALALLFARKREPGIKFYSAEV
jgi:hypothetical protein